MHLTDGYLVSTDVSTRSLPKGTLDTIKKYREEWSQHSGREVDAIVRALEPNRTNLCKRLDTMALVILCSILVHTEPCLAQQRGLCLLAVSLFRALCSAQSLIPYRRRSTGANRRPPKQ